MSCCVRIELFSEFRADGKIIRSIAFKIPLGSEGKEMITTKDGDVFLFSLDCSGIDVRLPEKGPVIMKNLSDGTRKAIVRKGTYRAIKEYVIERFDAQVSCLYIAQVKRKYGIEMGKAYNKPDNPKSRIPKCTPEKEKMILEALRYYDLLPEDVKYMEDKDCVEY